MQILLLTQYYPPETGAPSNRLSDLVQRLSKWGHRVTVLTALPNYPTGKIFDGYRGRLVMEEENQGIRTVRTWIHANKGGGVLPRLWNYFSFALSSLLLGTPRVGRPDVVIVESPPIFLGLSGLLISRWKRAKLVMNISDLWPASVVALGIVRSKTLIRLATRIEEFLYRRSCFIAGQTQHIVEDIRSRCPQVPVGWMPNGVNAGAAVPDAKCNEVRQRVREELSLNGHFVVGYAGLHGLAQGLTTAIQSARLLSKQRDILFAFFGEGPEKENLKALAAKENLANVRFFPMQPVSRVPEILCAFDVALVPLKRHDLFKGALPSKMFEAMAGRVPVLVSVDGEARAVVEESGGGIYVEPENPEALAAAVLQMHGNADLRKVLGRNGRRFVEANYDRQVIARGFERSLLQFVTLPRAAQTHP